MSDTPKIGDWVIGVASHPGKPYVGRLDGFATIAGLEFACLTLQDGTAANVGASTLRPADLADRIVAAIEETEEKARRATPGPWDIAGVDAQIYHPETGYLRYDHTDRVHIVHNDPAAVLRRCVADRKIVAIHRQQPAVLGDKPTGCGTCHWDRDCQEVVGEGHCSTIRALAEGYDPTFDIKEGR